MNPVAITMWVFATSTGYAIGDMHGAGIGLAISSGLTLIVSMLQRN